MLQASKHDVVGIGLKAFEFTTETGSIADRAFVTNSMQSVDVVLHAATLHKPHVAIQIVSILWIQV